jgi:hypothetical protein
MDWMDEIMTIQIVYESHIARLCQEAIHNGKNRAFIPLSIFEPDFPWTRAKKFFIDQCLIYELEDEYLVLSGWTCG